MNSSWYKRCLPTVSDTKQSLSRLVDSIRGIAGVKDIYIFGSLVDNFDKPNHRIKDIDVIIKTPFHSEDLVAINHKSILCSASYLEDEGYDPAAVKFSKDLKTIDNTVPVDVWVFSSDKRMLHWGPMISTRQEADELNKEASEYATKKTGFNLKKIQTANYIKRKNWYSIYRRYIQAQLGDMPSGWYSSEENISSILKNAIKLS